uniref:Uncharacterized protein n=1 Tax=Arundo donax TaxID=35708 RepID=A0A0A9C8T6_ARUDO
MNHHMAWQYRKTIDSSTIGPHQATPTALSYTRKWRSISEFLQIFYLSIQCTLTSLSLLHYQIRSTCLSQSLLAKCFTAVGSTLLLH